MTDTHLVERLRGLIERLEKLERPSRDADWRVEQVLVRPEAFPETALWPPFMVGSKFERSIPSYTASLDAAVALVERVLPGWSWEARKSGFGSGQASVWNPMEQPQPGTTIRADHKSSPAIALVIATLRALSQEQSK